MLVAAGVACTLLLGCGGAPKPRKACLVLHASKNLNLYDEESHPLTVYVYPLENSGAFEQTTVEDLLGGAKPEGLLGPPVPITVTPDSKVSFEEMFPARTTELGVLADYFRARGDPEGTRTQVVPAKCGMRKPKLVLSPKDMYRK